MKTECRSRDTENCAVRIFAIRQLSFQQISASFRIQLQSKLLLALRNILFRQIYDIPTLLSPCIPIATLNLLRQKLSF